MDGDIACRQFPSLAPRLSGSLQHLATMDSLDGAVIEVEPGVRHFVGRDVFHMVATTGNRAVTQDYSQTSDYKAIFLAALFHIARDLGVTEKLEIDTLVMGLPLSTVYTHSSALREMAKGMHTIPSPSIKGATMEVVIQHVTVIAQPQGALLAHGLGHAVTSGADFNTLVLDMGGGTFDWFMAKGVKPNRMLCGAAAIGALACASAVCNEIRSDLKDSPEVMARVDRALRESAPTVLITGVVYEMKKFELVVQRVLQDAIEQMRSSVLSMDAVDRILVTGGGAPLMYKALERTLPQYQHLLEIDREPVSSNVRGFHILAEYQASSR